MKAPARLVAVVSVVGLATFATMGRGGAVGARAVPRTVPRAEEIGGPTLIPDLGSLRLRAGRVATGLGGPRRHALLRGEPLTILIHQNDDGGLTVTTNGVPQVVPPEDVPAFVVTGGAGDDLITADGSVTVGLTILAGAGNDVVTGGQGSDYVDAGAGADRVFGLGGSDSVLGGDGNDRIVLAAGNDLVDGGSGDDVVTGGAGDDGIAGDPGNDVISGNAGRDYLEGGTGRDHVDGGPGDDVIYGLDGNDELVGGSGSDYIDGGRGNDVIDGGSGGDMLVGGTGNDTLTGTASRIMAGGHGRDRYTGGVATSVYAQADDTGPSMAHAVIVDLSTTNDEGTQPGTLLVDLGDAAFQTRFASDVEALRSIPDGRTMLTTLDNDGRTTTVDQGYQGNFITFDDWDASFLLPDGSFGGGSGSAISYNPYRVTLADGSEPWMKRPPLVGAYHEMVHAYNAADGSMEPGTYDGTVPNLEQQAVGLPMPDGIPFDNDHDPLTPPVAANLTVYTENGFRTLLHLSLRTHY